MPVVLIEVLEAKPAQFLAISFLVCEVVALRSILGLDMHIHIYSRANVLHFNYRRQSGREFCLRFIVSRSHPRQLENKIARKLSSDASTTKRIYREGKIDSRSFNDT